MPPSVPRRPEQRLDVDRARAEARLGEALRSRDPIRFLPAARAHYDLRMREWTPTADGVRCRKSPVSNAGYQLFLLQADASTRWSLVPPHWSEDWFRGGPEDPVLGVLPWQAERLVNSLQGDDDRMVTALPRGANELSSNFAGFTIWSQKWDLLFLTEPPTPNLVLTTLQHSVLWVAFVLKFYPARPRARDLTRASTLDELRRTQFDFRATLLNYLKTMRAAEKSCSRSDLQFLIDCLQLLNDRLEGKAEPVEAIALVRRERARK